MLERIGRGSRMLNSRVLVVLLLVLFSNVALAEEALVTPEGSPFTLDRAASRTDIWNFGGHADLRGSLTARMRGSDVEILLALGDAQRQALPYLRDHGPPEALQIDDYDALEKLFPPEQVASLEGGRVASIAREVTLRVHHYQIWRDGQRVQHSVLMTRVP